MAITDKLVVDTTVSFELYPSILGTGFKNLKITSPVMSAPSVRRTGYDIDSVFANVYPSLPAGSPTYADGDKYVEFTYPSGKYGYVGLSWIKENTIVIHAYSTLRLDIANTTPAELSMILAALSGIGKTAIRSEFLSTTTAD